MRTPGDCSATDGVARCRGQARLPLPLHPGTSENGSMFGMTVWQRMVGSMVGSMVDTDGHGPLRAVSPGALNPGGPGNARTVARSYGSGERRGSPATYWGDGC